MLIIGLLLVALVCLAIGLTLASPPWLIGSVIGSALAGYAVWRTRSRLAASAADRPRHRQPTEPEPAVEQPAAASTADVVAAAEPVWVIDGRPRFHRAVCAILVDQDPEPIPYAQAIEDGFVPCSLCEPGVIRTG